MNNFEPSEELIVAEIVMKVPDNCPIGYNVSLYEAVDSEGQLKYMTSQITSNSDRQWLELTINNGQQKWAPHTMKNYGLVVQITKQGNTPLSDDGFSALFASLKPVLVVYTNNSKSIINTGPLNLDATDRVEKRETQLIDLQGQHCQGYSDFYEYSQLGLGNVHVIEPLIGLDFTFCFGHCNSPFGAFNNYSHHAEVMASLTDLPPPCCIPIKHDWIDFTFLNNGSLTMSPIEDVTECGCR